MGTVGLLVAGYFTFLPNFILIFMGAAFIEKTQEYRVIQNVLSLITAAVVGVIINLACYLGEEILFSKHIATSLPINWIALGWVAFSLFLLVRYRIHMLYLILASLLFGVLRFWLQV